MKPSVFLRTKLKTAWGTLISLVVPMIVLGQPLNNTCGTAQTLTSSTTCNTTAGTLRLASGSANATSGINNSCGNGGSPDVWYSFTAQTAYPTIRLSGMASRMEDNPRLQIFNATPGCAVANLNTNLLHCVSATNSTTLNLATTTLNGNTGLTVGATYLIRVSINGTSVAGGFPADWNFNICVQDPAATAVTDYGKSYINITKGTNGGTVDPGDILEIRATLVIRAGTIDSLAFYDTLKNTRGLGLETGQIALRTNEGTLYKAFGDNFGDGDPGWRTQIAGLDTAIQINMGPISSNMIRGALSSTSKPSNFGTSCIIMATYRVHVYGTYGNKINFGGGGFRFRERTTGVFQAINFPTDSLIIYSSPGLCQDAVSISNIVGAETNGTFGVATGTGQQNRGTSAFVPGYTYAPFSRTSHPDDYFYGVVNNTSKEFTKLNTWPKPDPNPAGVVETHRVHGLWEIIGDHTGATNQNAGNPPCDSALPVSASNPCGYMLIINASYKTDQAFNYSASGLCPNTYYEVSAWVRNICSKCGCDSNGVSSITTGYIESGPGDSSGVRPNLAFKINGIDYYTTGNIPYLGTNTGGYDANNVWVKKGFTYITGPSETSFNLTIRNNAPGGGGNDWALDDISVVTCMPSMSYSPSLNPTICESAPVNIADTVRSFYNNYTYYKWQRSTNNGVSWTDITGPQGPATPVDIGSEYEYITTYTVPPANTTLADSGDIYRLITGTTLGNLSSTDCQVTDGISEITLSIIDCGTPLKTELLSYAGKLVNDHANLSWTTTREEEIVKYEIERSEDGTNFTLIGTVNGYNNNATFNQYVYIDPRAVTGKSYYRLALTNSAGKKKYTRIIQLTKEATNHFALSNVINPFNQTLGFDVMVSANGKLDVELVDMFGKPVKRKSFMAQSGINALNLTETESLPTGTYILRVKNNNQVISRKVLKKSL